MRRLITAITLLVLLATNAFGEESQRVVELRVSSTDPEVIALTDQLLRSRFDMFNSATLTPIASERDGARLIYTFPGELPDSGSIKFLAESIGLVTMTLEDSPDAGPVITSHDIETIDLRLDSFGSEGFFIVLSPAAGDVMLRTSTENIGKRMIMKVDDTVLTEATIRGAFAREFRVAGPNIDNTESVYAVIRFGPLPAAVELVSFRDGT
ncbi:MAG: hypothetical protein QNI99_05075 [Woeseiaceae bacterium]|nr:hypothetical protein [Woeseiaceae bacterium]